MDADPIQTIAEYPPGAVIYGIEEDGALALLIRDTSEEIARIPQGAEIQIRAGFADENGVLAVVVLFRFRPEGPVYLSFWNYHASADQSPEANIFTHLADGSGETTADFIGDSRSVERSFPFSHPLASFFRQAQRRIERLPAWDDEAFAEAIDSLRDRVPDPLALWHSLATGAE